MSSFKDRNKLADDNEFKSNGNNTKTNYTVLDGTDLADIFVQDVSLTNSENNTNTNRFINGISISKEGSNLVLNYTTDTTFPNCYTDGNGKANCDYCNKGHCDYCNHVNCPTNGGHCTYCTHCTHCGNCHCNCHCAGQCQCQCHCQCQCWCACNCACNCDCSCASDGCGP